MLIARSYNSVVFQTIAANDIDFLFIKPAFLTTRGGWEVFPSDTDTSYDYSENIGDHYQAVQDTLLDEQYLNTSRFENISTTECSKRYSQTFIRVGNGFAVVPTEPSNANIHKYNNDSIVEFFAGTGQLGVSFNSTDVMCKSTMIRCYQSLFHFTHMIQTA